MFLEEATKGFMTGYFSTCRRSDKTRSAYGTDLAQLTRDLGRDQVLSDINPEIVETWAREMKAKKYSPASLRRKFAALRVFFSYWVRKRVLESSPMSRIRLDLESRRLLPRGLSVSDTKSLIEQALSDFNKALPANQSPRDRQFLALRNVAAIEVLFATGMRVGEMVSLGCADWRDEEYAFIVMGKGQRQRLAILPDERSRATVNSYLRQRKKLNPGHDYLFVNASGKKLSPQGVARILKITAERANLKTRVTPHMIRHTVATLLLRCGADIRVVQEVLGHSSISTTQRYTHVSKEHLMSTLHSYHPNNLMMQGMCSAETTKQLVLPLH